MRHSRSGRSRAPSSSSPSRGSFLASALAALAAAVGALLIAAFFYGFPGFRPIGTIGSSGDSRGGGTVGSGGILPGFEGFASANRGGNADKCTFLYYYMPGCPHCTAVDPTVKRLEEAKIVTVKRVRAGTQEARDRNVTGFPTFELMTSDGNFIKYSGDRSYPAFKDFILKNKN